jgi:hypothetical protein
MNKSLSLLEAAQKLLQNRFNEEEDFHSQRMVSNQLSSLVRNSTELKDLIDNGAEFPEWAQSEIAVAQSNIADVTNFMHSNHAEKIDEAFSRLPGHVINGDLYLAMRGLTTFVNSQKNGDDVDMQLLNTIIKRLNDIKKEVKKFNDEASIPVSYQYKAK